MNIKPTAQPEVTLRMTTAQAAALAAYLADSGALDIPRLREQVAARNELLGLAEHCAIDGLRQFERQADKVIELARHLGAQAALSWLWAPEADLDAALNLAEGVE